MYTPAKIAWHEINSYRRAKSMRYTITRHLKVCYIRSKSFNLCQVACMVPACRVLMDTLYLMGKPSVTLSWLWKRNIYEPCILDFFFLIVCFTRYFVFSIAVLPHSPGVVYYHLLLRQETRIPGVAPFSFRIGIWDLFVHRGQKSYTPTAFGKLWITPGVRCMKHASS